MPLVSVHVIGTDTIVSDIAVFVLKRDLKLQLTNWYWHERAGIQEARRLLMYRERPVCDFPGCLEFLAFSALTLLVARQNELAVCENLLQLFPEVDCWESSRAWSSSRKEDGWTKTESVSGGN